MSRLIVKSGLLRAREALRAEGVPPSTPSWPPPPFRRRPEVGAVHGIVLRGGRQGPAAVSSREGWAFRDAFARREVLTYLDVFAWREVMTYLEVVAPHEVVA